MYPYLEDLHFQLSLNVKFGLGKSLELGSYLKEKGWHNILVTTDNGLMKSGVLEPIFESLERSGITVYIFDQVEPNPKDTTVEKVKSIGKAADAVVGIGGGSSMDTAKATAILLRHEGKIQDFNGTEKVKHNPAPIIAIPTTAGTGSEVTANAAITDSETNYKMSIRSRRLIPKLSILDPGLLKTIPPFICATSSVDALTHAIEGYLSNRATTYTDLIALKAMEIIAYNIRPFYAAPSHTNSAANMLYGSMLAGVVITNTGTGNAHALARALGGEFDIAHGHACAMFLPPVLKFNAIAQPRKYQSMARALGLVEYREECSPSEATHRIFNFVNELLEQLNIPKYLEDIKVPKNSFEQIVNVAIQNTGPNPRKTKDVDLMQLLNEIYSRSVSAL